MTATAGKQDGPAIRKLREGRGIDLRDFAVLIDIHPASLTNIERDKQPASADVLVRIALALDVPLLDIVKADTPLHAVLTRSENGSAA